MLGSDFQFHQSNLQDFEECRRRFYYRSVQHLAWPSVEAEPVLEHERMMLLGVQFHRMIHQLHQGIPAECLVKTIQDPELMIWWEDFLRWREKEAAEGLFGPEPKLFSEVSLSTWVAGYRLTAKLDLLAITPDGRYLIYDWKTGGQADRSKRRRWFSNRMQTRVYPFVVTRSAASLAVMTEISTQNVVMTYWFAGAVDPEEVFPYSEEQYVQAEEYLRHEIELILRLSGITDFPLTNQEKQCKFCVYRSLCERGEKAASIYESDIQETADILSTGFDFNSQEEIHLEEA